MADKIYCGSAKIVNTQYGELTKISFNKDDINKIVGHMKSEKSDWINLVVKKKQNVVEGKPTHYLEVDDWKPNTEPKSVPKAMAQKEEDDLPF